MDFSTLTSAVDFSSVSGALMTVAAAVVGIYVTIKGINFVLGAIKRS